MNSLRLKIHTLLETDFLFETVRIQTVEAAYILVQEHLLEGLSGLKEDCRVSVRQQEVLLHSDMDQIVDSRRQLEEKVRGSSSPPSALFLLMFRG